MKDLELDYGDNKENCDHLVQRKNRLVLAAKPLDFIEAFRFVVIFPRGGGYSGILLTGMCE